MSEVSGYVFCADPQAHAASMSYTAAYLAGHGEGVVRAPSDYVPESSRRARGFATWAACASWVDEVSPNSSIAAARSPAVSAISSAGWTRSRWRMTSSSTRFW